MNSETRIDELSLNFAIKAITLYKFLALNHEYVISKQFLKAATSIGANIQEANAGQTKKDFTAKMAIASKEAREAQYWLILLDKSKLYEIDLSSYLKDIDSIVRVLTKIVKTSQQNISTKYLNLTPNT